MDSIGQKDIVVVANPKAGKLRRLPDWLPRLTRAVAGRGRVFAPAEHSELAGCCGEIAQMRPDALVIAGGDGTVMQVLSGLARAYDAEPLPPLVLLPFGTVNTTVTRWVGRGDPWRLLEQFLAERGEMKRRETLHVELDGVAHVAATLGTGLISHFFDEYERAERRGLARAAAIFTQVFFGSMVGSVYASRILAPISGALSIEGSKSSLDAFTLLICSVHRDVGLGLRPTYRAATMPGRIHLVATDLEPRRLGPQAWRVFLGRQLTAPRLVDQLVSGFSLQFTAHSSVILDGERLPARSVEVRAGNDLLVWAPQ
jgi:diacylglycerol kinase (ATP)